METAKVWSVTILAVVLVCCFGSMSVTWHFVSEVASLQIRVEKLEEDKISSVSQLLSHLEVKTSIYQEEYAQDESSGHHRQVRQSTDDRPEEVPNHHREARQTPDLISIIVQAVRAELEAHLNCSTIEPGPKGDPGHRGPQGETGDQGQKGERGETGHPGYPGFKGQKGEVGVQGLQGVRGERGEKGDMGTRGLVGEKGERGDTGPMGIQGQKGEKGHNGYPGFKGQKGEEGQQGIRGSIGEIGKKGDTGAQGPSGERGLPGSKGQKGEKGQLGYPGYTGNKGAMGEQGVRGEKGEKGDTGAPGVQGPKGEKGTASGTYVGPHSCGGTTGWTRVAYLDMDNSDHQCPGDMVEVTLSGKRLCGRSTSPSCASATFSSYGLQYSEVCGRAIGYQYRRAQAFEPYTHNLYGTQSIESYYVVGVSVTHGPPGSREHVWTFANGNYEDGGGLQVCPCAPNAPSDIRVPPFVGQDYFCEAGNSTRHGLPFKLYSNDALWDGDGCTLTENTCCQFNNPPYFTKQMTSTTSNDLEVRVCGYRPKDTNGDTFIELIELYVK